MNEEKKKKIGKHYMMIMIKDTVMEHFVTIAMCTDNVAREGKKSCSFKFMQTLCKGLLLLLLFFYFFFIFLKAK